MPAPLLIIVYRVLFNDIDLLAVEPALQIFADDLRAEQHGLGTGKADMGSDDGVLCLEDGKIGIKGRLGGENVQRGTGDHAVIQGIGQSVLIHDGTAGDIDEVGGLLHHGQALCIDHASGGIVQRAMEDNDIASLEQFFLGYLLNIVGILGMEGAALRKDFGAEGMEELAGAGADLAVSDDTDRLALELEADETILGLAVSAALLDLRNVADKVDRHTDGELCNRFVGIAACIADSDALLAAGLQADMVNTGKGNINKLQIITGTDDLVGHGHIGDDHDLGILGFLDQGRNVGRLLVVKKGLSLCFKRLLEFCEFFGGDGKGLHNSDFLHRDDLLFHIILSNKIAKYI